MCGIVISPCDDHYQPMNAMWARDLCTFAYLQIRNIPVQELWLKMGGGLIREGGHIKVYVN